MGAGVAGLRAAIELAEAGRVLVVAKDSLEESSSQYAQGGVAAALSDDDEVELHEQDTIAAGDGLCNPLAVHTLVEDGREAIQQLIEWGAEFDREGSKLVFAQEGAHSRRRVLHAHGDSTGKEIARALYSKAVTLPSIRFLSYSAITDLLVEDSEVVGAVGFDSSSSGYSRLRANAVLLATGGLGRVFAATTNPDVATGDGVAAAWRAGAAIADIEFVQFHPTALHKEGAPCFLLSEALRGEGARLINSRGEPFMERYHRLKDLAPRDVVSRSIVSEMQREGTQNVFLDLTHLDAEFIQNRFPRIYQTCLRYGVDISRQPAPVRPAAHYAMGGVHTDLDGRTTVKRLYAAGEVACTGVHGANRLASNSLLEGLVYGRRAGVAMRECAGDAPRGEMPDEFPEPQFPGHSEVELRGLTWRLCGILRSEEGLCQAWQKLAFAPLTTHPFPSRQLHELRSMTAVAQLIARTARAREESRGAHQRTDFPEKREAFRKHSRIVLHNEVEFF